MSTHCAIYVQGEDPSRLVGMVRDALHSEYGERPVETSTSDSFGCVYADDNFCNSFNPPTQYAIGVGHDGWTRIHFNCFSQNEGMASRFSRDMGTSVVVVIAQSTSRTYYMAVYRNGEQIRKLVSSDGEWCENEGVPLPFEESIFGFGAATVGDNELRLLSNETIRSFCEHLGLSVWDDPIPGERIATWIILRT